MKLLLSCARKDVRRHLADPMALILWIGIPLAIGGLVTLASGGGGGPARAKVLLVDQDETFVSELLVGAFQQGGGESPFEGREVALGEGRAAMDAGEASALVVVPAGFADALFLEQPAVLQLVTNPSQRILPGLVEEALLALVDLAFYGQRILGSQLRELRAQVDADGAPSRADVMDLAGEIRDSIESLEDVLFPPVLELESRPLEESAEDSPAGRSGFALLLFPGILMMSLVFVAQGTSQDLWRERALGTLRRSACSPAPLFTLLSGKLLASSAVMALISLLGTGLIAAYGGIPAWRALSAAAWATFAAAAFGVLMLVLQSLAGSERGGGLLTMMVIFPLMMVGGSFFPFEVMPQGLASIGRLTPNGMALVELRRFLDGELEPTSLLRTALWLAGGSALAFLLLAARVRSRFISRA